MIRLRDRDATINIFNLKIRRKERASHREHMLRISEHEKPRHKLQLDDPLRVE